MKCGKYERLIQASIDGTASPAEHAAVQAHTAECPPCAEVLAESRQLVLLLSRMPQRQVSDRFEQELMVALQDTAPVAAPVAWWDRFRFRTAWRLRIPALVTAATVAASVVAALVMPRLSDESTPVRRDDGVRFIASAVERHRQIEDARHPADWKMTDLSVDLNAGMDVSAYQGSPN